MSRYDRAITVFSPDGHLFQVAYAVNAVRAGSAIVAIKGKDCVVLGVERRATAKLRETRTIRKILQIDDHITCAFAGLTADARVLTTKARVECQSYRLTCEDAPTLEYVARFIARTQQRYTQRGGVRPFGVAAVLAGFSPTGEPQIFQTDPAGTYSEWKASAVGGKNSKNVLEFLEGNWEAGLEEDAAVRLAIKSLMEVVDAGSNHMSVVVVKAGGATSLPDETVDEISNELKAEDAGEGATEEKTN